MKNRFLYLFTILLMLSWQEEGAAQQFGPEKFRSLIVETVLPYSIRPYAHPYVVLGDAVKEGKDMSTPENALKTFFQSLAGGSYGQNEECWTPASRETNKKLNEKSGKRPSDWEAIWKRQYQGKRIELLNRIEYLSYVLVEYRVLNSDRSVFESDTLALEQANGSWFLTQALSDNPILFAWKSPTSRVQVGPGTVKKLSNL